MSDSIGFYPITTAVGPLAVVRARVPTSHPWATYRGATGVRPRDATAALCGSFRPYAEAANDSYFSRGPTHG